jgi:ribose transport system substrate-binding protein
MNKSLAKSLLVGLLLIALFLSGCAAPAEDEEIVVGWSGAPLLDDFQIQLFDGVKSKADELGVTIVHIEHDNDPVKQASDIEDLLAQDIDVLLIAAASADAVVPSVDAAVEKGIPVFSIDNAANSDKVLNHSGNDLYCIGYRSMEHLVDQIGGSGKVLHITGFAGMALVVWNDDGVQAYLEEAPDVEFIMTGYADWDPAKALAITEDVLTTHPDLAGIYVISEVMTQGPIQALEAQGLTGKVKVMSGGFAPESQEWLANGEIIAAFEWSSYAGGQEQMQRIYDYLVNDVEPAPFAAWPVTAHPAEGDTWQLDCPIGDWAP